MGGWIRFLLLISQLVLVEVCRVLATVWLSYWTNMANRPQGAPHKALWYLSFYAGISGVQVSFPPSGICLRVFVVLSLCCAYFSATSFSGSQQPGGCGAVNCTCPVGAESRRAFKAVAVWRSC